MSGARVKVGSVAVERAADLDVADELARGDRRKALTLLMKRYGNEIFSYCVMLLRDEDLAGDTHQTIFVQGYQDLHKVKKPELFRAYLYGIARHRCADAIKSRRRRQNRFPSVVDVEHPDPQPNAEKQLEDLDVVRALRAHLHELDFEKSEAVALRCMGHSFREIAEILREKNVGTVEARVRRAILELRDRIEKAGGSL